MSAWAFFWGLEAPGLSMDALKQWIETGVDMKQLRDVAGELFPGRTGFAELTDRQRAAVKAAYEKELAHV